MAIHCSILSWRIPWAKEPRGSIGYKELNMTELAYQQQNFIHYFYKNKD